MKLRCVCATVIDHCYQHNAAEVGDWLNIADQLRVWVSDFKDNTSNLAVILHEIVEAALCRDAGVLGVEVTQFDDKWHQLHPGSADEAGNDPTAPYHKQHLIATAVERAFVEQCGMTWEQHEKNVNSVILPAAPSAAVPPASAAVVH